MPLLHRPRYTPDEPAQSFGNARTLQAERYVRSNLPLARMPPPLRPDQPTARGPGKNLGGPCWRKMHRKNLLNARPNLVPKTKRNADSVAVTLCWAPAATKQGHEGHHLSCAGRGIHPSGPCNHSAEPERHCPRSGRDRDRPATQRPGENVRGPPWRKPHRKHAIAPSVGSESIWTQRDQNDHVTSPGHR